MEEVERPKVPQRETDAFPRTQEGEVEHLNELVRGKDHIQIRPVGTMGYLVCNTSIPYIAEAPLIMMDWDDTAAQTAQDKARCWEELSSMGLSKEVIEYCDKRSRVLINDEEPTYEPELEMRLLSESFAHSHGDSVTLTSELKNRLEHMRQDLLEKRNHDEYAVLPFVDDLYHRTRFTSTLYPDTKETVKKLRGEEGNPRNVALLTYGDPSFQFEKVKSMLDGEDVGLIFLTNTRKGKFFEEVIEGNHLQNIPVTYTYPETPRDRIAFREGRIPTILFDDDPKQVKSFNSIAEKLGLPALGVVRVRRKGVKRSDIDVETGGLVHEINPSDTYMDTDLFADALAMLESKIFEIYVAEDLAPALRAQPEILSQPDVQMMLEQLARIQNIPYDQAISRLGIATS